MEPTLRLPKTDPLPPWTVGGRVLEWGHRTYVMGILNVTPDSFSDGGRHLKPEAALSAARRMLAAGVDVIDVGGQSTRPGSEPVSLQEELDRLMPVIELMAWETDAVISVDTSKAEVVPIAVGAGAHMVNDVTGLRDPAMVKALVQLELPVVAMHMQGTPATMQVDPRYDHVVNEVSGSLAWTLQKARQAGLERVMVDPGLGFGKTTEHNLSLLRSLGHFRRLGAPVLLGASRKVFIGHVLDLPVFQRLEGTLAVLALAVAQGVDMVRVHDVEAAWRCVRMADAVMRPVAEAAHG